MQKTIAEGNGHADWLAQLIPVACEHSLVCWVENPDGSFLWLLNAWLELGCQLVSFFDWTTADATVCGGSVLASLQIVISEANACFAYEIMSVGLSSTRHVGHVLLRPTRRFFASGSP